MVVDFWERPFLPLVTERLLLRPVKETDLASLVALANDKRVAERLAGLPHPYGFEDAQTFLNLSQREEKEKGYVKLAITRRADGEFMGGISLEEDVGYWLGHPFWGQGYGKEAVTAVVQFAFLTLQKESLSGSAHTDNLASCRIFEGLGFTQTGVKECTSRAYEGTKPGVTYALSRTDFLKRYQAVPRPLIWAAAAALINDQGELLLAERPMGKTMAGVWEPPGGKIEPGETPEKALVRELKEEIGIGVKEEDLEPLTFMSYSYDASAFSPVPYKYKSFHVVLPLYLCRRWEGVPYGAEGQELAWVDQRNLAQFPLAAGDIFLYHRLADILMTKGIWKPFSS